jgi:hypothetical protein
MLPADIAKGQASSLIVGVAKLFNYEPEKGRV